MLTFEALNISRDETQAPVASVMAMAQRGFQHFLGNEVASKVVSKIKSEIASKTKDRKAESVSKDEIVAFRTEHATHVQAWTRAAVDEALKAFDEGTIGTRSGGGARVDPLTAAMNTIARTEVTVTLKANGIKVPKGDDTVTLQGEPFTMAQLIARRLEKHGTRIQGEADKQVKDAARKRAKLEAEAKQAKQGNGSQQGAEALGL